MGRLLGNKKTSVLRDGESEDACALPDPDVDLDEWGAPQPDDTTENKENDSDTTEGGNGKEILDKVKSANDLTVNEIIKSEWFPWAVAAGFGLLWFRKGN